MTIENDIWEQIKKGFSADISRSEFETWISQTTLKNLDSTRATIEVPNKFVARWLKDNYTDQIQSFFKVNLRLLPKLRFVHKTASVNSEIQNIPAKSGPQKDGIQVDNGLNPEFTFSNFVISDCNQLTWLSALEIVQKPGSKYNPLYIYSDNCSGKTHILHAIGNQAITERTSTKVIYLSSYNSKHHFRNLTNNHHNGNSKPDLLLLDNFHLIADHADSQQECIHIFDAFIESKKQIVVAASCAPTNIDNLIPQLKSRLQWGLVTKIQSSNQQTKVTLIRRKAKKTGLSLPEDVIFFLANSVQDLGEIDNILKDLRIHSSLYGREIGMSIVHSIIKNRPEHKISLTNIQKLTAGYFNISLHDLLSNKKKRQFSYPRQIAIYLSRNLTGLPMKQIGTAFGKKDHSTVVYALKCIEKEEKNNPRIKDDINKLKDFLLTWSQLKQECSNPD